MFSDADLNQVLNESFAQYDCVSEKNNIVIPTDYIKIYDRLSGYRTRGSVKCLAKRCSICLESFNLGERVTYAHVNKFHIYHIDCLKKWLFYNFSCPDCRIKADELLKEN